MLINLSALNAQVFNLAVSYFVSGLICTTIVVASDLAQISEADLQSAAKVSEEISSAFVLRDSRIWHIPGEGRTRIHRAIA